MPGMSPNVGHFPVIQRTEPTHRTFWRLGWGGERDGQGKNTLWDIVNNLHHVDAGV